ncbi:hypothetical protein HRbin26_01635 [bacterium HR26]|nr:hypothetical protein HRbin26_01635 [bacterium HR26]
MLSARALRPKMRRELFRRITVSPVRDTVRDVLRVEGVHRNDRGGWVGGYRRSPRTQYLLHGLTGLGASGVTA